MLTNPLFRSHRRGGFTLVELLVVIGIIAILAGVALGPITSGIKKAQQNSAVQSSRTIALAEFQYANDNNSVYPFGATSDVIAKALFAGNYISDPGILYISGSSETKYSGTTPSTGIAPANISYDFVAQSGTVGLSANTPDQCPVILTCVGAQFTFTAGTANNVVLTPARPFTIAGTAVCYHSNSAKFITADIATTSVNLTDASLPALTAVTIPGGG